MRKTVIIVAGGSGTRLGGKLPKQFQKLNGHPLLWWSMKAFHDEDPSTKIIVVLPEAYIDTWYDMYMKLPLNEQFAHSVSPGGKNRTESVRMGLLSLYPMEEDGLVAVHDGARPLVSRDIIRRGWEAAKLTGAAIPVVKITDSLRELSKDRSRQVDRSNFVAVQTPQVFSDMILWNSYERNKEGEFTDDASLVEAQGHKITLFEGSHNNIKVTNPGDMEIAKILMKFND